MRYNLAILKVGVAVGALAIAVPGAALAFDDVDWDWNKDVNERIDINVDLAGAINVPAMVELEKIQFQWGDVTATAKVDHVWNDAARPVEDGTVTFSEDFEATFSDTLTYTDDDETAEDAINPVAPNDLDQLSGEPSIDANVTAANLDEQENEIDMNLTVDGTITGEVDVEDLEFGTLDAADLPKIKNAATAVGNNQSIESTSALFLHDAQYVVGGEGETLGPEETVIAALATDYVLNGNDDQGNEHTEIAALLTLGGLYGAFEPAEIEATATVGSNPCKDDCVDEVASILNFSVDNAATAVANNISIDLDGADAASNTMIADVTQFAFANVVANASVEDVLIDGYGGFGDADFGGPDGAPLISNVATAVGNNLSISVGLPDVPAP